MTTTQLVGHVAVDSGQILLVDPCYVLNSRGIVGGHATPDEAYTAVCDATLETPNAYGEVVGGFATATLHGDGLYPVYAEVNSEGRIVSLTISFDDTDEDEDEEDSWYDDDEDEQL